MAELVAMSREAFAAFAAEANEGYAQDHVLAGNWSAGEALAKAKAQFDQLLPQGLRVAALVGSKGAVVDNANVSIQTAPTAYALIKEEGCSSRSRRRQGQTPVRRLQVVLVTRSRR